MSDYTKEAIEHGIAAVRWAVSALVASLHRDFDTEDPAIGELSNELRKGLKIIDDAWGVFCTRREMGEYAEDNPPQWKDGVFAHRPKSEYAVVDADGEPYERPRFEKLKEGEIRTGPPPHLIPPAGHISDMSLYPPIPGADKPNPLRRPTSEGEAQMRMEREMCKCPLPCPIHGGREGEK